MTHEEAELLAKFIVALFIFLMSAWCIRMATWCIREALHIRFNRQRMKVSENIFRKQKERSINKLYDAMKDGKRLTVIVAVSLFFYGCDTLSDPRDYKMERRVEQGAMTLLIDNCEYIYINENMGRAIALTHKGNCQYCKMRNKK